MEVLVCRLDLVEVVGRNQQGVGVAPIAVGGKNTATIDFDLHLTKLTSLIHPCIAKTNAHESGNGLNRLSNANTISIGIYTSPGAAIALVKIQIFHAILTPAGPSDQDEGRVAYSLAQSAVSILTTCPYYSALWNISVSPLPILCSLNQKTREKVNQSSGFQTDYRKKPTRFRKSKSKLSHD